MDVGFAAIGQLARHSLPHIQFLLIGSRLCFALVPARLAAGVISPLRFAITSRPSRCEEDLHLLAVDPARHTKKRGAPAFTGAPLFVWGWRETYGFGCGLGCAASWRCALIVDVLRRARSVPFDRFFSEAVSVPPLALRPAATVY